MSSYYPVDHHRNSARFFNRSVRASHLTSSRVTPVALGQKSDFLQRTIPSALIFLCAFFAPWGAGLQQVANFDLSKIFVGFMLLLVLYWLLFISFINYEAPAFPRYFNYYILLVALHTFIGYMFIFPEGLSFGYTGVHYLQGGFIRVQEANGIYVARFFLFALLGYALASLLKNEKQLTGLCLIYGAGLAAVMTLNGYVYMCEGNLGGRLAGGFLNPNAFGTSAAMTIFLNMTVLAMQGVKIRNKILGIIFIGIGVIGVLLSGSRGAMLGVVIGLLVVLKYAPSIKEKGKLVSMILVAGIMGLYFLPQYARQNMEVRVNVQNMYEGRGANRLDIWTDYLSKFSDYALTGVGLGRSREAIKDVWTVEWGVPHNDYLEVFVEFGIIGLLLFIIGLQMMWKRISSWHKIQSESKALLSAAILGLFSAWLVISFFQSNFLFRDTWIVLGVIAAHGSTRQGKVLRETRRGERKTLPRFSTKDPFLTAACQGKRVVKNL